MHSWQYLRTRPRSNDSDQVSGGSASGATVPQRSQVTLIGTAYDGFDSSGHRCDPAPEDCFGGRVGFGSDRPRQGQPGLEGGALRSTGRPSRGDDPPREPLGLRLLQARG